MEKIEITVNGATFTFARIPEGKFLMGSPDDRWPNEGPQHEVSVPEFYMQTTPVTQAQYLAITGQSPSYHKGDNLPVENVSWFDCKNFCKLAATAGMSVRLPSEAEWEYACRAGTTGDRYGELDEIAWHRENSGGKTHVVGQKKANGFGLYDMLGNVWEWVEDDWHDDYYRGAPNRGEAWVNNPRSYGRVVRGGSFFSLGLNARGARRYRDYPDLDDYLRGFRVVFSPLL